MFVIRNKKIFIGISLTLVALSILSIIVFGLKPGIDFTGGSAIQLKYNNDRPDISFIEESLENAGFGETIVQPTGENGVVIKTHTLTDNERSSVIEVATHHGESPAIQESYTAIGPSVGKELTNKALISVILVFISIIFFVAYAFRKVSKPVRPDDKVGRVSSWKYGFVVILTLLHDVIIPAGVFAVLGHIISAEVDTLFVVALLTTFALSISDTIVVFDRIRENLTPKEGEDEKKIEEPVFSEVVGKSLSETYVRSMNTSILVLVSVLSLAVFGPKSTQIFAVMLSIGMFVGTYSSIFLASPLLVLMENKNKKR